MSDDADDEDEDEDDDNDDNDDDDDDDDDDEKCASLEINADTVRISSIKIDFDGNLILKFFFEKNVKVRVKKIGW